MTLRAHVIGGDGPDRSTAVAAERSASSMQPEPVRGICPGGGMVIGFRRLGLGLAE